jgi:hypothetical protein
LSASPDQNGLPVIPLVPCGNVNDCELGVPPNALTVRKPPVDVGLPTIVFGLPTSLPLPMIFRLTSCWVLHQQLTAEDRLIGGVGQAAGERDRSESERSMGDHVRVSPRWWRSVVAPGLRRVRTPRQ